MINNKLVQVRRLGGVLVVAVALVLLVGAAPAAASSAWWHVTSGSWPSVLPSSGEGRIDVVAENLGDAPVTGSDLTITDKLPAGVVPRQGIVFISSVNLELSFLCAVSGQEVSCVVIQPILELFPVYPYEDEELRIPVKVQGASSGAINEVRVSGGGSTPAVLKRPLSIGDTPAGYGVEDYELAPENDDGSLATQAGSHPFQLTTTLMLNQTANPARPPALPKDLRFDLPPGLIGNPTPFPQCTTFQFSANAEEGVNQCPQDTVVGVADVTIEPFAEPEGNALVTFPVPLFNLTPAVGEPARFAFDIETVPVILDTSVRTGGDYGVTVSVNNISELAAFLSARVTFWGVPGDPRHDSARGWDCIRGNHYNGYKELVELGFVHPCAPLSQRTPPPLLALPTSCTGALQTTLATDSWANPGVFTSPFGGFGEPALDGCNRLPFSASINVAPDGQAGSTPTGLTVGVRVPQEEALNGAGLSPADVKDTTVSLPSGVVLNPSSADGLLACSEEQIALSVNVVPSCPDAAKVATLEIKSPLLPNALTGEAYLAAQNANPFGSLVALYLVAKDPVSGVLVKVAGEVKPDPVTGQLVSTFKNTPQLPFEDLRLHFFGGSRAPLSSPALCGSYTTSSSITPWSGNAPAEPSSEFQILTGPNGSACANPLPFSPSLTAGTTSIQAGGFSPFTMTMSRPDGSQNLQAVKLKMPPGLLGTLATVKLCKEAEANAGTCGPESLIGHTIVSVGVGGNPYSVTGGEVFITEGYRGAPYGLSIVNPAKAGPYDLGKVIVRAKVEVDPITAALTVTTDTSGPYKIPTILDGIPLQIQHINVSIDRPGFTFNPTNCSPLQIGGSLTSDQGAVQTLSVPFQITNCAVLAFKPKLTAKTNGKTSRANGASLSVKLTYPAGPYDANISKVKVDLPKQLPSRLTTLQKACPAATFNANPAACPAASIVGHAKATTPVLPVGLEGPAYFVSHGGEEFPQLVIVLQGYGTTVHLVGSTFINKAGITSSTFKQVPDVPVGTFELTLPQGRFSALAANGNLCTLKKLAMPTSFVAQNGMVLNTSTPIVPTGCAKKKAHKAGKHHKGHKHRKKK
jgi:hypothetical protein